MNKFIAFTDVAGTFLIIVLSILDHVFRFNGNFYFITLIIGIVLLVPVTVREAYSLIKMREAKKEAKKLKEEEKAKG